MLSAENMTGLKGLLQKEVIPKKCHEFYENLAAERTGDDREEECKNT
jgi:hypothetical protein